MTILPHRPGSARASGCARPPRVTVAELLDLAARSSGDPDWTLAHCPQVGDPDAWFPERGERADMVRRVCLGCPIQGPCLVYALDHGEEHGVWGGSTEQQRRKIHRMRVMAGRLIVPPGDSGPVPPGDIGPVPLGNAMPVVPAERRDELVRAVLCM